MTTTTCLNCNGNGYFYQNDTETACPECHGNGYVAVEPTPGKFGLYETADHYFAVGLYGNGSVSWLVENGQPVRFGDKFAAVRRADDLNAPKNRNARLRSEA